ncbi:hypothetical protein AAFF_G00096730 [Aldrovandia affinis]|uniref:Uncharacterized protein n=1 Tax=Aldrovandia affinis TaxID=143900 RepID=A0AAD7RVH1_9TELE|nr:hypothetical protein AAFF_G00096730 [Aldrovandia affinis]
MDCLLPIRRRLRTHHVSSGQEGTGWAPNSPFMDQAEGFRWPVGQCGGGRRVCEFQSHHMFVPSLAVPSSCRSLSWTNPVRIKGRLSSEKKVKQNCFSSKRADEEACVGVKIAQSKALSSSPSGLCGRAPPSENSRGGVNGRGRACRPPLHPKPPVPPKPPHLQNPVREPGIPSPGQRGPLRARMEDRGGGGVAGRGRDKHSKVSDLISRFEENR